ncbi:unnamed protein product [Brassica rapa]|uniref:Uncharacterized protein n=1 Tax=Brassica campestris TaxID=3711 RepID=A0A8D9DQW7_BRACM|nr:unnamed protein product [Brassica rapa]
MKKPKVLTLGPHIINKIWGSKSLKSLCKIVKIFMFMFST